MLQHPLISFLTIFDDLVIFQNLTSLQLSILL